MIKRSKTKQTGFFFENRCSMNREDIARVAGSSEDKPEAGHESAF